MKRSLQKQILRFSIASIFGLVLAVVTHFAAAQNLTIQVNSQTDKPLALEAQVCDTDLNDQEQTCSFRAALELVEILGSSAEAKFETFQIDFSQLDTTDSIQIRSPLPKINYPVIIDGSGSNCSNPDLAYTPKVQLDGGGAAITPLQFTSLVGDSLASAHGSKVCHIAVNGFAAAQISIKGEYSEENSEFKDRILGSQYQIFGNHLGFASDGLSYSAEPSTPNLTIDSTNNLLIKNNLISAGLEILNSDNINLQDNTIGLNIQNMSLNSSPIAGIFLAHSDKLSNASSDSILIAGNVSTAIKQTGATANLSILDNQFCVSSFIANDIIEYLDLCPHMPAASFEMLDPSLELEIYLKNIVGIDSPQIAPAPEPAEEEPVEEEPISEPLPEEPAPEEPVEEEPISEPLPEEELPEEPIEEPAEEPAEADIEIPAPIQTYLQTNNGEFKELPEMQMAYIPYSVVSVFKSQYPINSKWILENIDTFEMLEFEAEVLQINPAAATVNDKLFEGFFTDSYNYKLSQEYSGSFTSNHILLIKSDFSLDSECLAFSQPVNAVAKAYNYQEIYWLLNETDKIELDPSQQLNLDFLNPGPHRLQLIAKNSEVFDSKTLDFIIQQELSFPNISFETLAQTTTQNGIQVKFLNNSIGSCLNFEWDFDSDGQVDSTTENPTHMFTPEIDYSITLKAANSKGEDQVSKLFNFFEQEEDLTSQNSSQTDAQTDNDTGQTETQSSSQTDDQNSSQSSDTQDTSQDNQSNTQDVQDTTQDTSQDNQANTQDAQDGAQSQTSPPATSNRRSGSSSRQPRPRQTTPVRTQVAQADSVSSSAFHSQQPTQQQTQYPSQNRPAVQNNKATIIGSRAISRQSFISFAPAPSTQKVTQPATALSSPSSTSTPASSATTNTGTQTNTTATSNSISNATNTTNTTNSNTTKTLAKTSTIKNHIQAEVIKPAKSLTLEAAMAINAQARRDKKATVLAATPKQKTHFGLSQIGDLLTGATWLQTPRSLTAKKQAELSLKASELKLKQIPANIQRLDVLGAKQVSQHAYAVIKNFDYSSSIAPRLAAKQSQQSQQTQGTLLDSVSLNKLGLKQAQAHNSYLKHRALYKTPAQHSSKVLLELAAREKFASSQFVINGYFDNLFPATDKGARFYLKKPNQDWQLLTSQTVDLNGNFSYINKKKLADGSYELLVEIESLDGLSSYSKVFEIVIDSSLPKLDPVMPLIKVANTVVENFYKMPRQALTLQLEKLMPNLQLVVNLQSVLYSSVAVTSSSNSQLSFELPQLAEFQPGSHHKLTVYAASLEDPDLKSEPVVLEFQIEASFVQKVMAVIDKVIDTMSF